MAATFEKAKTYVFTEPVIRDREVGGSNPLAPTIYFQAVPLVYTEKYHPALNIGRVTSSAATSSIDSIRYALGARAKSNERNECFPARLPFALGSQR